jgi:hypothetical protein
VSTSDCTEIGSGPCPCGKGLITVERCTPDHAWGGGFWYESHLACGICRNDFVMFNPYGGKPHRLVRRSDVDRKAAADKAWHDKLREVEATSEFRLAKAKLEEVLRQQKSAAARYRILHRAGLADMTEGTFRRRGGQYHFTASNAALAMAAIGMPVPSLEAHTEEVRRLADVPCAVPNAEHDRQTRSHHTPLPPSCIDRMAGLAVSFAGQWLRERWNGIRCPRYPRGWRNRIV